MQSTPDSAWTVNHNLGYRPDVSVIVGGVSVDAAVTHVSANQLTVNFSAPYVGEARWRGDAAGLGGFFSTFRFGCSSAVAGQRLIVGLLSSTAAISTSQSPSALTSCVFIGNDSGDANLQIMYNDATGTCTKIDLGASFPVPSSANNAIYEVVFFAKQNHTDVGYRVLRVDTGATAEGSLNTDLPSSTTFLAPHMYVNNNGVASAVILDFCRYYLETDT